ncbi:shikimate dehydrogenase [Sporolactobacillus sp. THM7-4]|nr:shikimate dehydrogenase [Sporolactobacillus sp. THM7-4]
MRKWYGIIGDPIEHTLSPMMHEHWFKKAGLSSLYLAFHVNRSQLARAVEGMKVLGIGGFNVTVPHKSAIIPFLDEIDDEARMIGAVNTVVHANGRLIGYNTDGTGFLRSLVTRYPKLAERKPSVLLLGAGGAARAVALTLAKYMALRIDIANRTLEKAIRLSGACRAFCPSEGLDLSEVSGLLYKYDIVINATSTGLYPDLDSSPVRIENTRKETLFADIIYKPCRTAFLRQAEKKGNPIINGLPMLIEQGALAFEKWTGLKPDTGEMENLLQLTLKRKSDGC